MAVRVALVDEDGTLFSTTAAEIALAVTDEIEPIDPPTPLDRPFRMPVCKVLPRHSMSRGSPTLMENNRATTCLREHAYLSHSVATRVAARRGSRMSKTLAAVLICRR